MKTRFALFVTLSALGATPLAPGQTYASGFLHAPVGTASLSNVNGRVVTLGNIGSSGEDGVEVYCRSAWGGGVGVDLTGFGGVGANREIKIRPKGWDGTIKGNLRAYTEPATGDTFLAADFSDAGAAEFNYVEYDEHGDVVANGILPAGGIALGPCVNQYQIWYVVAHITSLGPPIQFTCTWYYFCSPCPDPWQWYGWSPGCGGVNPNRTIVLTTEFPLGTPGITNLESFVVTGRDLPDLDGDGAPDLVVGNADLKSFPISCPPWNCLASDYALHNSRWGLGQAQLSEQCTPDSMGGCDETVRRLVLTNLGSSGQDGVAVALPPGNGGVAVELAKGNCCRGHVIIMKAFDDEGQELRVSRTQTFESAGTEVLGADFSALGAAGYLLRLYGGAGEVLGPPEGTAFYGGGVQPSFTGLCPPGAREVWIKQGTPNNPVWVFQGCEGWGYEFVLPGVGVVPGVASFSVEPVGATSSFGDRVRCEVVSDDDEGLVITNIDVLRGPTYVSGLLHSPLGTAELGTVTGRRLPVHNLGSSGEDGVEIHLHSVFGGGAQVDLEPFLSIPGATLRHKHKGWDGLIYGNHRMVSNGDGSALYTLDYSDAGATSVLVEEFDANGILVSSAEYIGPIVDLPLNSEEFICPPDCIKSWYWWTGQLCSSCPIMTHIVFTCTCAGGGGSTDYTERVITPTFPPEVPEDPGFESLLITGGGMPELVVSDAAIRTFNVPAWGVGQVQISETCDNPADCAGSSSLHVSNIGAGGGDGLGIGPEGDPGSIGLALQSGNCCRGHVIIMKAFDDEGHEQRIIRTQIDALEPLEELDADFSSLGATGFKLTLYNAAGAVVGPPDGTAFYSGGPKPVFTNRCQPGQIEWWINVGTPSNPVWEFQGCLGLYDFILPGLPPVPDVARFSVEPLDALMNAGPIAYCEILTGDPEGLVIGDVLVTQALTGDLDCSDDVGFGDINPFVLRLSNPAAYHAAYPGCPDTNGDIDGDGVVGFGDINPFVALLSSGG